LKFSLRKKLILSFAVIIIGALAVIGLVTYNKAKAIVQDEIRLQNEQTVRDVDTYYLTTFMNDMQYVVKYWSAYPQIVKYRNEPGQKHIVTSYPDRFKPIYDAWKGYVDGNPDIAWVYFAVQADGSAFFTPLDPTMPDSYDARTREWYKGAVGHPGQVYWTSPYLDAGSSGEMLVTASKVVRDDNETVGVMAMDIKLRKFSELIRGLNSDNGGYLMLLGGNGDVYAHPQDSLLMKNLSKLSWVHELLGHKEGSVYFSENGQDYIGSYITVEKTGWKLVSVSPIRIGSIVREIRSWTVDAAILAAFGLLILGSIVTAVFLTPLTEMMDTIREVIGGNMEARMKVKTNDELGRISSAFNQMLLKIKTLMMERDEHVETLTERNEEINEQKAEITALYEETEAMNEELTDLLSEVRTSYLNTAKALANAIEANDNYTRGHCDRVRYYAMKMAYALKIREQDLNDLEFASMLHDIGKLGVPTEILNRPHQLSEKEFEAVKRHPRIGFEILEGIPFLEECRLILLQHHERVDGTGYPDGIPGDQIHFSSKILSIVDAYDAMTSSRPYRSKPLSCEAALLELERSKGTQFDEALTDFFITMVRSEEIVFQENAAD